MHVVDTKLWWSSQLAGRRTRLNNNAVDVQPVARHFYTPVILQVFRRVWASAGFVGPYTDLHCASMKRIHFCRHPQLSQIMTNFDKMCMA